MVAPWGDLLVTGLLATFSVASVFGQVFTRRILVPPGTQNNTMPGNTRHTFVDPIFSNTASSIGDIEKSWVHLYMVVSKYLPQ